MGPATLALRTKLLRDTLDLAVERSPYYKEHLGQAASRVRDIADLVLLPTIRKEDVARNAERMLTSVEFPARIGLSSGTSYGYGPEPPALSYQSQEEIDCFIGLQRHFFKPDGPVQPLSIDIITAAHGTRATQAAPGCFLAPLDKPFHLAHFKHLLSREFSFPGFSTHVQYIAGALNLVKLLAVLLQSTAPEVLGARRLRGVFTHGAHLSRRWRRILEEAYAAPVLDIYGLSEITTSPTTECALCGAFHPAPAVVAEVISPFADDEPVTAGVGELVLTSLSPFQTLQPLIRYRTGDLVEVQPACDDVDDLGFRLIGRTVHSLMTPELGVLLPSSRLGELIDDVPEVLRTPHRLLGVFGAGPLFGAPVYRIKRREPAGDPDRVVVDLEIALSFVPAHFPERVGEIDARLRPAVHALTGAAARAHAAGRFAVETRFIGP